MAYNPNVLGGPPLRNDIASQDGYRRQDDLSMTGAWYGQIGPSFSYVDPSLLGFSSPPVSGMPGTNMDNTDDVIVSQNTSTLPPTEQRLGLPSATAPVSRPEAPTTSRRVKNREKWTSIKDEVFQYYVVEGKTLEVTMAHFQNKYSFKACLRKWKMQMKEWNFDKNINKHDMAILEAKSAKRARDEGKETVFYIKGKAINPERFANFKKRRVVEQIEAASPSAATPIDITYETPRYENVMDDMEEDHEVEDNDHASQALPNSTFDYNWILNSKFQAFALGVVLL